MDSKRVFPFPFSSNPDTSKENTSTGNTASGLPGLFPPTIANRVKNGQKSTSGRFPPPLQRIFPQSHVNNSVFGTPQRVKRPSAVAKDEPVSPANPDAYQSQSRSTPGLDFDFPRHHHRPESRASFHARASSEVEPDPDSQSCTDGADIVDIDQDLSELMNRRMREAKMLKAQLAEERLTTLNLRTQLSTLQQTKNSLESRLSSLQSTQTKLSQLESDHASLVESYEQLKSIKDKSDDDATKAKEQIESLEQKVKAGEARVGKVKEAAQKGILNLGKRYDELEKEMQGMKKAYEDQAKELEEGMEMVEEMRRDFGREIEDAEAYFDSSGRHLLKCDETRGLVQELQTERNNAQQVIDMLRDKLFHLSTEFAEAKEKVKDLEEAKKEEGQRLVKGVGKLEEMSQQFHALAARLSDKEKEQMELLNEGYKLEVGLEDANTKLKMLTEDLERKTTEAESIKDENTTLRNQNSKLEEISRLHKDCALHYTELQQTHQKRDGEIVALKGNIQAWKEKGERDEANLANANTQIQALESQIRKLKEETGASRTREDYALNKVKELEEHVKRLRVEVEEGEEEYRQLSSRLCASHPDPILQERFDAQTMTLKLTKEHSGDLQERFLQSEKDHVAALEQLKGTFKTDLSLISEQKSTLEATVEGLSTEVRTLQSSLESSRKEKVKLDKELNSSVLELARVREEKKALEGTSDVLEKDKERTEKRAEECRGELVKTREEVGRLKERVEKESEERRGFEKVRVELGKVKSEKENLEREKDRASAELRRWNEERDGLEKMLEKEKNEASRLGREMEKKRFELESLGDKLRVEEEKVGLLKEEIDRAREEWRGKVTMQERLYEERIEAEVKKAEMAEKGMESVDALKRVLEEKLEEAKVKFDSLVVERAEKCVDEEAGGSEALILKGRVMELEQEVGRLQYRDATLGERYKKGDLNDSERAFVDSLMAISQTMYEQDIVEKDNELRRRDNMNRALQDKIRALEVTLAKRLKDEGQDVTEGSGGAQIKSMVDLNLWMPSSSPLTPINEKKNIRSSSPIFVEEDDQIKDDTPETVPVSVNVIKPPSASGSAPKPPPLGTSSAANSHLGAPRTFASIDKEGEEDEISDYDDDMPLTKLGKRSKPSSSVADAEPTKPARRAKTAVARKTEKGSEKVIEAPKPKTRKRR
ncbi:hypothetical protein VKT23_009660 [Stygiomarasmius scandens]|uniref:Uncharacterized protein n=1 Tax=Marasmiellus scandens TaxID=2682957 RepID=A0ABR1JED8_9AGAR